MLLIGLVRAAEDFEGKRFYAGDLHVHTGYSFDAGSTDLGNACEDTGGCGAIVDLPEIAADNGLDFFAVTDHVNGANAPDAWEWEHMHGLVRAANAPERGFVTVPGAELFWTTADDRLGHKNVLFFGSDMELEGLTVDDVQYHGLGTVTDDCDAVWEHAESLSEAWGPLLFVPHHPAGDVPMPTDWDCQHATWQPTVEAYSGHGNSFDEDADYDALSTEVVADGTVHTAYDLDVVRLGVHAATDNHTTRPGGVCQRRGKDGWYGGGVTIAVMDGEQPFDRTSLYEALSTRRTMASSGPLLPLSVDLCAGGARLAGLGQDLEIVDGEAVEVRIRVPEAYELYVTEVELVTADYVSDMSEGLGDWRIVVEAPPAWMYVRVRLDGEAWYGEVRCDDGGDSYEERIWTSVSYVDRVEGELSPLTGCPFEPEDGPDTGFEDTGEPPELLRLAGAAAERDPDPQAESTYASGGQPPEREGRPLLRLEPACACGAAAAPGALALLPLWLIRRRRR